MTLRERKEPLLMTLFKSPGSSGYQLSVNNNLTSQVRLRDSSIIRVEFGLTGKFKSPNYQAYFSNGDIVTFLGRYHRTDNVNARYKCRNLSSGFLYDGKTFVKIDE